MLNGRILIVSDRAEVVAELEPILRAGHHLPSVVPDAREAMRLLDEGTVPDVVISDTGVGAPGGGNGYVRRFRELNRAGAHLVVAEPGTDDWTLPLPDRFSTLLPRPFRREQVTRTLSEALSRMEAEFRSLRAEVWRSLEHHITDHWELADQVSPDAPEFLLIGILHVVDAWDAMTSERAYRQAMPRDYWEPLLRAEAGRRFHPLAAGTLLRLLQDRERRAWRDRIIPFPRVCCAPQLEEGAFQRRVR